MPTILREIDADIVRIDTRCSALGSPQYVFAVHPLNTRDTRRSSCSRGASSTFIGSTLHPVVADEIPVFHEVARTYSQCRRLYKELRRLTNGTKKSACRCCSSDGDAEGNSNDDSLQPPRQPACPCRALFSLLDAFMFPRRRLLRRRSPCVLQERRFALSLFIKSVLQKLQSIQHHDFEQIPQQEQQQPAIDSEPRLEPEPAVLDDNGNELAMDAAHVRCKVLAALLRFLALEDASVELKLREMSQRLFGRLNLEGWHSDRKNLYFLNEDSEGNSSHAQEDGVDGEVSSDVVVSCRSDSSTASEREDPKAISMDR